MEFVNGINVTGWSSEDLSSLRDHEERVYAESEPESETEGESIATWHEGEPVNEFNLASYERKTRGF